MTDSAKTGMSKGEREELRRLVNERARLEKTAIAQREAELRADVEEQLARVFSPNEDGWAEVTAAADKVVAEANARILEVCDAQGVRREFAPSLQLRWFGRGQNAVAERRSELRKVAATKIDAAGKAAKTEIERAALERRTELAVGALKSAEAKEFLAALPSPRELMPTITVAELESGLADRERAGRQRLSRYL